MQGLGEKLLSGSCLARYQHAYIVPGQTANLPAGLLQGTPWGIDDPFQGPAEALGSGAAIPCQAQGRTDGKAQGLRTPRPPYHLLHRFGTKGLQKALGLSVRAEQNTHGPVVHSRQVYEEAQPFAFGEVLIAQDDMEMVIGKGLSGTPERGDRARPPQIRQAFPKHSPLFGIGTHHQHARHLGHS